MEQKKLISILHHDMVELEELIRELKYKVAPQAPEIKFLHTRAQGMKELIEMLYQDSGNSKEVTEKETHKPQEDIAPKAVEEKPEKEEETQPIEKEEVEPIVISEQEPEVEETVVDFEPTKEEEMETPESLEEPETENEEHKSVGESFKREASVNDRVGDNKKLDYKLGQSKIDSLQTAIGINDRFLFIRELFGGDAEQYKTTIAAIDSKNSLKEAVDYLSQSFKWKKSDASISFINLLKRRFLNE